MVRNLPANVRDARDSGLVPGSGRSPGGGNGNPLQYSCLVPVGLQSMGSQRVISPFLSYFDSLLISKISYQVVFSIRNLQELCFLSSYMFEVVYCYT